MPKANGPFDRLVFPFWSIFSKGPKRLTFYFQVFWASETGDGFFVYRHVENLNLAVTADLLSTVKLRCFAPEFKNLDASLTFAAAICSVLRTRVFQVCQTCINSPVAQRCPFSLFGAFKSTNQKVGCRVFPVEIHWASEIVPFCCRAKVLRARLSQAAPERAAVRLPAGGLRRLPSGAVALL